MSENKEEDKTPHHFIKNIIEEDLDSGKVERIVTRFPPEPNGYLHIGHASAALLNYGLAKEYSGQFHLRFDDTNPEKEDLKYVEAIQKDLRWLGLDWQEHLYFASDYFDQLYLIAQKLIQEGKAYVCHLSPDEVIEYRGTLTKAGRNSPTRDSLPEHNLRLFEEMKAGKHADGSMVLRAKINMSSGNVHMRDPILYRIRKVSHPKLGNKWPIYPSYDFTHCLSDAIEGITHSLCSIEFQDHRPLYDWIVKETNMTHVPKQYEFTRLNLNYTVTSKRKLKSLVDGQNVDGWDDPRMPTLAGMRNRGYPPIAIRKFCKMLGVSRRESIIDMSLLEECVRNELNESSARAMAVLNPLKVTLSNFKRTDPEFFQIINHPKKPEFGHRKVPFSNIIYIDRSDFQEVAEKKFFRLAPGKEVRLRGGYIIKCDSVIKDSSGDIIELECSIDYDTLGKKPEGRKVKGVIHWVDGNQNKKVSIVEYDRLFCEESPSDTNDELFKKSLNPKSINTLQNCIVESSLESTKPGDTYQFERIGYFVTKESSEGQIFFSKIVSLKDSWSKEQNK